MGEHKATAGTRQLISVEAVCVGNAVMHLVFVDMQTLIGSVLLLCFCIECRKLAAVYHDV